ncbi:MAG: Ldh family oxidoreductase [Rhizobiales bacterium]|nr:Ldh family oxidoreductase [Hyphomicrobiales bacterium]
MGMANESTITLGKADLLAFASDLFVAAGVARAMADEWAGILIWANLRGVDSHGVIRIPRYLDLLRRKTINTAPNIRVEKRAGAVSILEADRAPGVIAMARAMEEAIDRARAVHVGWCAARNITHSGAIGYFALMAAEAGMAGIVMGASSPMMAYHGARVAGVSSNPLALAVPGKKRGPLVLDMSTATVANGKVIGARDAGAEVPLGWGIDAEGRDTTDPKKITTLLALGGPKGSGLSLLIECLTSLTVGNPLVARALLEKNLADNPVQNGLAIAVDLSVFGNLDGFTEEVDRLGDAIVALPRADGVSRIFLPGERGNTVMAEREAKGIPIPKGTWNRIVAAAQGVGIEPPRR